jgi:hypothetical protein
MDAFSTDELKAELIRRQLRVQRPRQVQAGQRPILAV